MPPLMAARCANAYLRLQPIGNAMSGTIRPSMRFQPTDISSPSTGSFAMQWSSNVSVGACQ